MLSLNEIKSRAFAFAKEHSEDTSERAEAQTFWNEFFNIFGVSRRRVAAFEKPIRRAGHSGGFADLLWKGTLLIEHKSAGEDLSKAYSQALDYFEGLKENELPKYVLVCDFQKFKLYNLDNDTEIEFNLSELPQNIQHFGFISGYKQRSYADESPASIQAAEKMGKLYDMLKDDGYEGHHLKIMLVRLLFCLFAEDTGIFEAGLFREYIDTRTNEDGSDLGYHLSALFQVLNTPIDKRQKSLDIQLNSFPYVNGHLFEETIKMASFNFQMRLSLLDCCSLDWSKISPAIFGSLFQSVMDSDARRNYGAHYTREENILKVLEPLFLNNLKIELQKIKNLNQPAKKKQLENFINKLSQIIILDPACGCGNFLVLAYRELRKLELEALLELHSNSNGITVHLDLTGAKAFSKVDVDQFYGIEIEEFPAQIARVALWLTDHQMNIELSHIFGSYYARLPLVKSATIVIGNALNCEWSDICNPEKLTYIIGNPPFKGKKEQNEENKEDMKRVFQGVPRSGTLDYVTCWYRKAAQLMNKYPHIVSAFVSTNSICQGEQVAPFWDSMKQYGVKIQFCHRTFQWSNEARGVAAVHCIIIGFAKKDFPAKLIFDYNDVKALPNEIKVKNINAYLIDYDDITIMPRRTPLQNTTPPINYGSIPYDKNHLVIKENEYQSFIDEDRNNAKFIKTYWGGEEFLHNTKRYCLWLVDIPPSEFKKSKLIMDRIKLTKKFREGSDRQQTRILASTPYLFGEIRQPQSDYLLIPKVSSETRNYIPMGFCPASIIASGSSMVIPEATEYHFGILTSSMHMVWMRHVAGRMKSDYQYSNSIVYNTFPWPENISENLQNKIINSAREILKIRQNYTDSTLADLYDISMPPDLVKAHRNLDKLVESAYGVKTNSSDLEKMKILFTFYSKNIK